MVIVGNAVLWHQLSSAHAARVKLMGETISAQLALSLQEPMVRGEHLTINVMLNDLLSGIRDHRTLHCRRITVSWRVDAH